MSTATDAPRETGEGALAGLGTIILWTVAVAAIAGYAAYALALRELREELAMRPPVVVLDLARIASEWPQGATPAERASNGLAAGRQQAGTLAREGYLVLDRGQVLAAPDALAAGLE